LRDLIKRRVFAVAGTSGTSPRQRNYDEKPHRECGFSKSWPPCPSRPGRTMRTRWTRPHASRFT
jgi:hypothetical protein